MSKRRALLIGVPEYESDAIADLSIVRRDVESLHGALERSGFSVRSLGTEGTAQTGRSKILQALRRECRESQGVETLLLYFSGHGMHYRGKDYLIPSDAVLDDPDFIEEYLVPTDLGDIIDQSGASTIVFFIDACREGVKLGFKDTYLAGWSRGERRQATRRSFVVVFACGPGQVSQYVGEDEGFSLFSKALAEVLDPQYPAASLEDVLKATQERLSSLVAEHQKQSQQVHRSFESAVGDDTFSRVICEGATTTTEAGNANDPWSEAVLQSPLWKDKDTDFHPSVTELKQQVVVVVAACWQQWQTAIRAFPEDPWRDEALPIRVLENLELLIFRSDPPVELTDAETALIVTVPFIREAVIASGLVHMASANPLSLEREPISTTDCRVVLEREHQSQPRFSRKAKRLREQGRASDSDAVMAWLLHRCLLKTLELWQPESERGYLSNTFYKVLTKVGHGSSRLASETFRRERLLELAHCMYTDLERIDRDDRPNALKNRVTIGRYREEQEVREKMLAYLLQLAGMLAMDIRLLSEVLVDHIGLADPLTPNQVLQTVNQARWNPTGRGRVLRVMCDHPAVDLALSEHVEHGGSMLTHIFRQVAEKRQGMDVLAGLPTHLLPDGIVAVQQNGIPVYQTPHVNFQLAHDEVRELLMGEQLYGDPMLAIRELYQNAMDACRYRQARLNFLKQSGQYQENEAWEGKILFRQGTENGRPYLECEDNGIGMAMPHLSQCFARAGRRFADLPEFIEEQAEWLKCEPPIRMYPNSQFGVGVLSYFMLADEIEVETCRLDRKGQPGNRLQVRIPGSSGLFRAQSLGSGHYAGTRVRLYLNRTHHKGQLISCIETLRKLLWVAEFRTEVQQFGRHEIWEPNQLRHPEYPDSYCLNIEGTDIWWVPESEYWYIKKGCILSDGLRTAETQPGFVFNLRQEHLPKLTVDRRKIVEWDQRWVRENLLQNSAPLLNWQHLDLNLLWKLASQYPQVTSNIADILSAEEVIIPLMSRSTNNLEIPISQLGCFAPDLWLCYFRYGFSVQNLVRRQIPWWILPYRVVLWGNHGLFKISEEFSASIPKLMKPENCPRAEPGDGTSIIEDIPPPGYGTWCISEYVPPAHMVHVAKKLDESLALTVRRFQKFSGLGLKIPEIDFASLNEIDIEEEDIIALSRRIEEVFDPLDEGKTQWRRPWIQNRISAAQIVLASTRLNEPIGRTIKRLQKFQPIGIKIVSIESKDLEEIKITPEDLIALSTGLDGQGAWSKNFISPVQIAFVARQLNEPITATLRRFERFLNIGLKLPDVDLESINGFRATEEDMIALSIGDIGERVAWSEKQLPIAQLVQAAWRLGEPLNQALKRFQRFTPLGLVLPQVDLDLITEIAVTREDALAFSEQFTPAYSRVVSTWLEDQVTSAHLITASINLNESIADTFNRFQKFSPLGLKLPQVDLSILQSLIDSEDNVIALSKCLTKELKSSNDLLQGEVHPTRIILAALALKEPVTSTLERFRRFAPALKLTLPGGEPDAWQFCATED